MCEYLNLTMWICSLAIRTRDIKGFDIHCVTEGAVLLSHLVYAILTRGLE